MDFSNVSGVWYRGYTRLYYTILYYTILYYTILYYTILYYTILYYTILYYTILYYTILYYIISHYTRKVTVMAPPALKIRGLLWGTFCTECLLDGRARRSSTVGAHGLCQTCIEQGQVTGTRQSLSLCVHPEIWNAVAALLRSRCAMP